MCWLCVCKTPLGSATAPQPDGAPPQRWASRRGFMLAAAAGAATVAAGGLLPTAAQAQVSVGEGSRLRHLVPAAQLEAAAAQQYRQMMEQARQQGALAPDSDRQLRNLRAIAQRQIPFAHPWNARSRQWQWEVNLIRSEQINAFVMPGGKIAFFTGILDQLRLSNDEIGMIMGHEAAHAVREHARARLAKTQATSLGLSLGASCWAWAIWATWRPTSAPSCWRCALAAKTNPTPIWWAWRSPPAPATTRKPASRYGKR